MGPAQCQDGASGVGGTPGVSAWSWKGAGDREGLAEHREGGGPGIPEQETVHGKKRKRDVSLRKQVCILLVLL